MGEESRAPTVSDYLVALDRRKWILLGGWCLVIALVAIYNELAVPVYSSEAKLLLVGGGGGKAESNASQLGLPNPQRLSGDLDMGTQVELLKSQSLKDDALALMEVHPDLLRAIRNGTPVDSLLARCSAEPDRAPSAPGAGSGTVRQAVATLSASQIAKTSVASISCESVDPEVAADAVNALCLAYLRANLRQLQAAAKRAGDYISDQLAVAESQLAAAETAVQDFQQATGITSPDADAEMRATRLAELTRALADARAQRAAQDAAIARLDELLRAQPETIVTSTSTATNPIVTDLEKQLTTLEVERVGLLARYKPGTPQIDPLDARIAELKKRAAAEARRELAEREESVNPLRQNLLDQSLRAQIEQAAARARQTAADRYLREARRAVERVPEQQRRLADLTRTVSVAEQAYLTLKQLEQQYAIAQQSQIPTAQVAQTGKPGIAPIKPDRRLNLLGALAGGLLLGMALVLIAELVDDTFHSPQEVERLLNTPVLGVVRYAREAMELSAQEDQPRGMAVEAFRTLRSNISFASVDHPLRVLMVTSARMGDGKTTVATNLGIAFAQAGSRVLLADTDLRLPALHKLFGLGNSEGLTSVLAGGADLDAVLATSPIEGLWVLTSGPLPPDPVRLLESNAMRNVLETLRAQYDVVILDSPPAGMVADAQILGAQADGALLVVEFGKSKREAAADAIALLERSHSKLLGVVANKVKRLSGRYSYHHDHRRERV